MKYLKLFENWNEISDSVKEELKKNYEKYVMDKDYIPNLIKEKIEQSFPYNSPIIQQIKFDTKWDPITFNELSEINSKLGNNSIYGPNLSDFSNVCVAGLLYITADKFFTRKGDHPSDETAVINERIDSALAKATKELDGKLWLPPKSSLDNSGSHGLNCFVRDKKVGTKLPPSNWYNQISGIKPNSANAPEWFKNSGVWGNNPAHAKIVFGVWLVLDKTYCEAK